MAKLLGKTIQRRRQMRTVVGALLLGLVSLPVFGQTDTGSIVGTVHDPKGTVVPGAQIGLTNTATNVTTSFVTNADGATRHCS